MKQINQINRWIKLPVVPKSGRSVKDTKKKPVYGMITLKLEMIEIKKDQRIGAVRGNQGKRYK